MKKTVLAATLLALCATAPAFAHDTMNDGAMMQKKANMMTDYMLMKEDTNRDGFISKAECNAAKNRMFRKADVNRDGALSGQEIMDANYNELENMKNYAGRMYDR